MENYVYNLRVECIRKVVLYILVCSVYFRTRHKVLNKVESGWERAAGEEIRQICIMPVKSNICVGKNEVGVVVVVGGGGSPLAHRAAVSWY